MDQNDLDKARTERELDNLVMFPSSKNFARRSTDREELLRTQEMELANPPIDFDHDFHVDTPDPLETLLNEGKSSNEIVFEDLISSIDEEDQDAVKIYDSVALLIAEFEQKIADLRQMQGPLAWAKKQQLLASINQRINYYLGELERYLPNRNH